MITGVPYDAEVEYLESTGTQWIDTGLSMRDVTSIDARVLFTADRWQIISGGTAYNARYVGESGAKWMLTHGSTALGGEVVTNTWYYIAVRKEENAETLTVDGTQVVTVSRGRTSLERMGLFARERYNSGADGYMYGKIAYARFYSDGILVRDFIPVSFTNELGVSEGAMYDRVTKKLFRNKGTGSFIVGLDVAKPVMGLHFYGMRRSARDYVQDGLIAMWDGIENAGWGVHDPNATVWKDLIGGHDLTLGNGGSWSDNALICDGTNVGAYSDYAFDLSEMTKACCISGTVGVENVRCLVCTPSSQSANSQCAAVQLDSSGNILLHPYVHLPAGGMSIAVTGNNTKPFVYSASTQGQTFWANGTRLYGSTSIELNNSGRYCCLGARRNPNKSFSYPAAGRIHSLIIYNKILSADAIAHNYLVDRVRFNLPEVSA